LTRPSVQLELRPEPGVDADLAFAQAAEVRGADLRIALRLNPRTIKRHAAGDESSNHASDSAEPMTRYAAKARRAPKGEISNCQRASEGAARRPLDHFRNNRDAPMVSTPERAGLRVNTTKE
jgi:hypothetical protein